MFFTPGVKIVLNFSDLRHNSLIYKTINLYVTSIGMLSYCPICARRQVTTLNDPAVRLKYILLLLVVW